MESISGAASRDRRADSTILHVGMDAFRLAHAAISDMNFECTFGSCLHLLLQSGERHVLAVLLIIGPLQVIMFTMISVHIDEREVVLI